MKRAILTIFVILLIITAGCASDGAGEESSPPSSEPENIRDRTGTAAGITENGKPVTEVPTNEGAEATIAGLYRSLSNGMTWGEVWDEYVYEGSKTLGYTRASFISEKEEFQSTYDIEYRGVTVTSSKETKPGVFLVNGKLEYEADGEVSEETGADYVVFDGGEYFISLSGSLLKASFANGVSSVPDISCIDVVVCEYADRTIVECTLQNLSNTDYYIGTEESFSNGELEVSVWKNNQSVTATESSGWLDSGGYYAMTLELPGYSGTPEKLSIDSITQADNMASGDGKVKSLDIMLHYQNS